MKVKVVGKNFARLLPLLEKYAIECCDTSPDLIIAYGGDGALLGAEREYPGIAKFPLRDQDSASLCRRHGCEEQIRQLAAGDIPATELMKLESRSGEHRLLAINDIFIHNLDPVSAVRYRVWINGRLYANEIVGDGVGLATVHGSTAYYRSITHSIFRVGIGLAFSNSTEVVNHLVLPDYNVVKVEITRGPAVLVADNSPERISLQQGDCVTFRKAEETALIYGIENFMCRHCRRLRHTDKYHHYDENY